MYKILEILEETMGTAQKRINEKDYRGLKECNELTILVKQSEAAILVLENFVREKEARDLIK